MFWGLLIILLFQIFLYLGEIWQYSDFRSLIVLKLDMLIWEIWNMMWHCCQLYSQDNENLLWQMLQSTKKCFDLKYSSEVALVSCHWALGRCGCPWQRTLITHLLMCSPPCPPAYRNNAQIQLTSIKLNCFLLVDLIAQVCESTMHLQASLAMSISQQFKCTI